MPPHTLAFNYYYTAPPYSVIHPPDIDMPPPHLDMPPEPNTYNHATGAPAPMVASLVPAAILPVATAEGPQGGINLNLLMAMQLEMMSQMNMRTLQSIFPVSGTPVSPASLPNNAVPGPPALIDDNKLYPKIDEFLESLISKDPGHNICSIMTKLLSAGMYRISDIYWFEEQELTAANVGLLPGEAKWLLREVKKEIAKLQ